VGVRHSVRVEGVTQHPLRNQILFGEEQRHEPTFLESYAVLSGQDPADLDGQSDDLLAGGQDTLHDPGLTMVEDKEWVQVAVAGVEDVHHDQAMTLSNGVHAGDHLGQTGPRDHGVVQVVGRLDVGDRPEGALPALPDPGPLPLVGVTAVIIRGGEVLLGRRSDNHALTPITGIVDPGEEPADAAVREAAEEAGVVIRADRLAWVHQIPRITYANGDQSDYLDLTFRCTWISGDPVPVDGEMTEVAWYPLDALGDVDADMRARIAAATPDHGEARFVTGGSDAQPPSA